MGSGNNLLRGVNVYLIGMMGSGKSTVGETLARKLNYRFFDTDVLIERVSGKTISEIFASSGESYFRDLETQVLREVSAYNHSAIATGGGIIQKPVNWGYLRQGLIVWLDVSLEILTERVTENSNRPLAVKLESLLEQRLSIYSQADLQIICDRLKTPEQIADEIVAKIPSKIMSQDSIY